MKKIIMDRLSNKNNLRYVIEFFVGILVIPGLLCLGVIFIPGPGTNDGWLGFWGGYLGSFIAIIFAITNTRYQINAQRKNDLEISLETKMIEIKYDFIMLSAKKVTSLGKILRLPEAIDKIGEFLDDRNTQEFEAIMDDYNIQMHLLLNLDPNILEKLDSRFKDEGWKVHWKEVKDIRTRISNKLIKEQSLSGVKDDVQLMKNHTRKLIVYVNNVRIIIAGSMNTNRYDE